MNNPNGKHFYHNGGTPLVFHAKDVDGNPVKILASSLEVWEIARQFSDEGIIYALECWANVSGPSTIERDEATMRRIGSLDLTLQANIFRNIVLPAVKAFAAYGERYMDPRNQVTATACIRWMAAWDQYCDERHHDGVPYV